MPPFKKKAAKTLKRSAPRKAFDQWHLAGGGSLEELSTQELIDLAAQGDPAARDGLVERLYPVVWAFLSTCSRDSHRVRDLTQSTFIIFVTRCPFCDPRFRRVGPLRGWLRTVAFRLWNRSEHDSQGRWRTLGEEHLDEMVGREPDPPEHVGRAEMLARLRVHIAHLPPESREIIRRTVFEGTTFEALSAELGVAAETLRGRAFRARHLLERRFRGDDELLAWITENGWKTA